MSRLMRTPCFIPVRPLAVGWLLVLAGVCGSLQAAPRLTWMIGSNAAPGASGAAVHGEFSPENAANDPAPGLVTRQEGDPEYVAGSNPAADDDFYFAGGYPAGFNQLTVARTVPFDEPPKAWERALTQRDRTNRIHFNLEAGQTSGTNLITLRAEIATGGSSIGGVLQPGFGSHEVVVRFRNGSGVVTELFSGTLTAPGDVVASFTPNQVQATVGANSLEMVRNAPNVSGTSYWIIYDYVLLTTPVQPDPNTPPAAPLIPEQHLPENGLLTLNLNGPRMDTPGLIAYSLGDSITDGSSAFPPEIYAWNALVSAARGWPLTNLAYGSATISDINWQLMPGFMRTNARFHGGLPVQSPTIVQSNQVTLMLTGYNDGRDGFGRTNQTAYQAFYRAGLRHAAAFMSIPTSGKSYAQAAVAAGGWSPSPLFGGAMGRTATADASTLTFSNLSGRAIYIGYLASASNNMGSFAVTVDGQSAGVVSCTGAFGNRSARSGNTNTPIPPNVGILGDSRIFESPLLFRVGGLGEGPHTVTVTTTASGLPVTIFWAAGSASARAGLAPSSGPSVWIGGTLRSTPAGYINGSDAGMAVFTQIQSEIATELASDGLQVQHVRAGDYFDPLTAMGVDNVHPSNLGHSQIATAFLEKLVAPASDAETGPAGLSFELLSGPAGMTLSPSGLLAWSPDESRGSSTETVQFRVSDAGSPPLSQSNSFSIQIAEVNSRPVSPAVPEESIGEGDVLNLPIPVTDADLPANTLVFELIQGPAGATLDPAGVLEWIPDELQGGTSHVFQVRITDNGLPPLSVTNQFVRHVLEVNSPPVPTPIPPIALAPGESLDLVSGATDPDVPAQTLLFEKIAGPDGLTVGAEGLVGWAPSPAQTPSAAEVRIRITDNGVPPLSATNAFQVSVVVPNTPPNPSSPEPQSLDELQPWQLQLTASDDATPAGQLVWALVSGPGGLSLSPSGLMEWSPSESEGPTNVVVHFTVTDSGEPPMSTAGQASLTVNEVNLAPVPVPVAPIVVLPPDSVSLQVQALDGDLPPQGLLFELISGPMGLTVTSGGQLNWPLPESLSPSTNEAQVRITDSGVPPLSTTNVIVIVVTEANSPPTTTPVPSTAVVELAPFELALAAEDAQTPGAQLTWTLLTGPGGLTLDSSGVVRWTPSESQAPSNHPVRVLITDNGSPVLGVTNEFLLLAQETNTAPVLAEVPGGTVGIGGTYQYSLVATDPDIPANTLSFALVSGPQGFTVNASGLMQWTPGTGVSTGPHSVTVSVTDNGAPAGSHTRSFIIEVTSSPARSLWEIGQDAPPGTSGSTLFAELGQSNGRNDPAPGAVTRLPGDPQFSSTANPAPDDDYYFAGTYPAGFNGLTSTLNVPQDEPWSAWERSHTLGDRTNRIHFHLSPSQAASAAPLPVWLEFAGGGWSINGVVQSGFSQHDLEVSFRSGTGVITPLYSGRLSSPTVLNLSVIPLTAQASAGPNTLEIVRTGPAATQAGQATWIQYDYVKILAPAPSTPPVAPVVPAQTAQEQTPWSLHLGGPRTPPPGTTALFLGDGAAAGLLASPVETASWPTLLAAERGWNPLNLAFESATVPDLNWQLMPGFVRTNPAFHGGLPVTSPSAITTQHVALLLTGYEEGREGFGETNQSAFQDFYRGSLRHAAAFLTIPTSAKTHAQAAAGIVGSWTPYPGFGGAMGLTATGPASTLTFSNLAGRAVYLGYLATASNTLGAFQVTVDGVPAGTVPCTGAFGNRVARLGAAGTGIPANVGTQGDGSVWESPMLWRLGNLTDGPHTVTVAPVDGQPPVTILWASASGTARQGLTMLDGPSAWIGSALRGAGSGNLLGSDAATARLTQLQADVCDELAGDGLQVRLVRAGDFYDPSTGLGPDGVHPGTSGHARIASAFREALVQPAWDAETPPAQMTFALLQGPPGLSLTAGGLLAWTPTESQGGLLATVGVQVTDGGFPPLRATNEFTITVNEVNSPPSDSSLPDWIADAGIPLAVQWPHGDPDLPPNDLSYQILQGPPGLTVSGTGALSWTPAPSDAPGTNVVSVRVTDNGVPPLQATQEVRIIVRAVSERADWLVGTDSPPGTPTTQTYAEFAAPNARNDAPPGAVTRLPGDPQYVPGSNPAQDDDYYFSGLYPAGFNLLTSPRSVPSDEPATAFERSLASNDRTNRVHLVLAPAQVASDRRLRISFEFTNGGVSSNGVTQPGFGQHEVLAWWRNGNGVATLLYSNLLSARTNIVLERTIPSLGATAGPNSLELVRTGPNLASHTQWILFDYLRVEALGPAPGGAMALMRAPRVDAAEDPSRWFGWGGRIRPALAALGADNLLEITFRQPASTPPGTRYIVESSEDLVYWSPTPTLLLRTTTADGWQTVTVQAQAGAPESARHFLRVRVVTSTSGDASAVMSAE